MMEIDLMKPMDDATLIQLIKHAESIKVEKYRKLEKIPNIICRRSLRLRHKRLHPNTPLDIEALTKKRLLYQDNERFIVRISREKLKPDEVFVPDVDKMEKLKKKWYKANMDYLTVSWFSIFDVMTCYVETFGDCFMSDSLVCKMPDGELGPLGFWLLKLKVSYSRKTLQIHGVKYLENLVNRQMLSLDYNKDELQWAEMFGKVFNYQVINGERNCNVPYDHCILCRNQSYNIGQWLNEQRVKYFDGSLRYDRQLIFEHLVKKHKLNLNIDGMRERVDEEKWSAMFQYLLQYEAEYGHCNVPTDYNLIASDNTVIELGNWLAIQRDMHRAKQLYPDWERRLQEKVTENKLSWENNNNEK